MEKQFKILESAPLQVRNYTDRNGEQKVFKYRPFIISDGIDKMYAEAQGEYAESIATRNFTLGTAYTISLNISMREWQAQDGTKRFNNDAIIRRIGDATNEVF